MSNLVGAAGFNLMANANFPKTITCSTNYEYAGTLASTYDGDLLTNKTWGREVSGSGVSLTNTVTITLPGITLTGIYVKWGNFGREPGGSGSCTLAVNGVTVLSVGHSNPQTSQEVATRAGVTEVLITMNGSTGSDPDLNPRGAWNYLWELELWTVDSDGGGMLA